MKDKEKITEYVFVIFIVILISFIGYVLYQLGIQPDRYRVCGSGWSPVCFVVDKEEDIKKSNGCVTDGMSQICGTYQISIGKY